MNVLTILPKKIDLKKEGVILPADLKRKTAFELRGYIPKKIRKNVLANEKLYMSEKNRIISSLQAEAAKYKKQQQKQKASKAEAEAAAKAEAEAAAKAEAEAAAKAEARSRSSC